MAGEWTLINLDDVCSKIGSGATPRGGSDVYLESGPYALIRSQNVYNDGFHHDGLAYIDEKHAAELDGVEVLKGDVLLNITGDSVARACQVDPSVLPARVNQHVAIIRPDSDKLDPRFLRYFLVSPEMQVKLLSWAGSGGTRNALTKGMIESVGVLAPEDITEQRAIAHILGTLDDKIELNRRMNETLEAIARALFQSWFVDFDPVRAKMEGRWRKGESLPGLPAHLYDLFPDSFEESELGEIPRGWELGSFGGVVEHLRDQENPLSSPEALYHHFSLPAFDEGQSPKAEYGESIKSQKSRVPAGVVLLSKLNPEIERVWLVDVRPAERAICSTEFLVLRAQFPFTRSFVYCLARSPLFRQQIEGLVTGTSKSHQRAQVDSILHLAVVVPPSSIAAAFDRSAEGLLARTLKCRRESCTLAALRDALLPRLISGELRITISEAIRA
ncbi:restriction endonuclease subunit S [Metallibacterium sp.]|uniref:restriction endonuclease subunit S n=1 Tax=Metallibacterium sp. TaxID=2940281 RepID=UPI002614914E|nr:restriction endonuclease subunit S [Metallibacterium sp.]